MLISLYSSVSRGYDFMTEKQKIEVERMRRNGIAYSRIAVLTGLSRNTVKSYCRRLNFKSDEERLEEKDICLQCGKTIVQREKVKRRKFCCTQCKTDWWKAHPDNVNRKANYELRCASCGKDFVSYGNKNRKYCCHECYINARFKGMINDG